MTSDFIGSIRWKTRGIVPSRNVLHHCTILRIEHEGGDYRSDMKNGSTSTGWARQNVRVRCAEAGGRINKKSMTKNRNSVMKKLLVSEGVLTYSKDVATRCSSACLRAGDVGRRLWVVMSPVELGGCRCGAAVRRDAR